MLSEYRASIRAEEWGACSYDGKTDHDMPLDKVRELLNASRGGRDEDQETNERPFAIYRGTLDDGTPYIIEDWEGILPAPGETFQEYCLRMYRVGLNRGEIKTIIGNKKMVSRVE